jgi:hypothetical protein
MTIPVSALWTPERQREELEQERVAALCIDGTDNHERIRSDDLVLDSNPPKWNWLCARCGKRGTQRFVAPECPPSFDFARYTAVVLAFLLPDPPLLVSPAEHAALTEGTPLPPEPTEFYEGNFFHDRDDTGT